jgi:hypothetical protein
LMYSSSLILHVVPLSAFDSNPGVPLGQIEWDFGSFAPIASRTAASARINFDGVLKTSNADERATKHRAYPQLYRNGVIESVDSALITDSSGTSVIFSLDDLLIQEAMRIFQDLRNISVEPPYALLVSLVGVMGARFNLPRERVLYVPGVLSESLDRDQYHFVEVIFDVIPTDRGECAKIIRPILDQVANIGGRATSLSFDDRGSYIQMR